MSDVVVSLNRLLQGGSRVRWDWLAPLAAFMAFLKIVTQWWAWFGGAPLAAGMTFGMYLGVLISSVMLFLMAAATLPDAVDGHAIDLRIYYGTASRRFWLLFALHWVVSTATTIWMQMAIEKASLSLLSPAYLIAPAACVLAVVRNRILHTVSLLALVGLYLGQSFGHVLGH